ncbi:MAG: glucose-6-phosphate dehydrogenase [Candidatus Velthaea sp.]
MTQSAPSCTIVIFGAAGDLTKRLLMPSLYDLAASELLDARTQIIGADHNKRDAAGWRREIGDALHHFASEKGAEFKAAIDERVWSSLAERLDYIQLDFATEGDYGKLSDRLHGSGNVLFYLAVSPRFFEPIANGLAHAGLLAERSGCFRRMLIEKPFGRDVESACRLNAALKSVATETQIYRVDHFLGKEAVQGIPALRFGSRVVEPLLNRKHIASVQITAAETVGVEERGAFYETTGALRDMVPNHLFSLLTLLAMDRPGSFEADAVRGAKAALLAKLQPLGPQDAVRGQYAAGTVDGQSVRAYRDEDKVAQDSRTETYAALRVHIDNERWRRVPFYLRTGKRLSAHVTTIALTLRPPDGPLDDRSPRPHLLVFGIDPQRGLIERFAAKRPGVDLHLGRASLTFRYDTTFDEPPNVGYETLLYHAMCGQSALFQRADMIESEWAAVEGVLDAWSRDRTAPESYEAGSAGPRAADALLEFNGDGWLEIAPLDSLGSEAARPQPVLTPV